MATTETAFPSAARANYALIQLMIATFTALLDRNLFALVLRPIRAEFLITDTQASLLQGLAFAAFYSVLGLPFGRLVDRSNRRNIIAVGILLWSFMTVCCGLAENYQQLFFARLGVGFGEACLAPAAYSLITDLFPPQRHGRALSFYTLASITGSGGSFILGAQALAFASQLDVALPIIGPLAPWRLAFIIVGLPGVIVAVLMMTIIEPPRHGISGVERKPTLREVSAFIKIIRSPLATVIIANGLMAVTSIGLVSWLAVFLARTHGTAEAETGHWIGILLITSALIGGSAAGWISDSRLIARTTGEKLMMQALGGACALPFAVIFPLAPTMITALAAFFAFITAINVQSCTAAATLQDILPNRFKGQVTAVYWIFVGLIGFGGGPTAVALVTDHVFGNDAMLRYSLIVVAVPCLCAALISIFVGRAGYQAVRERLKAGEFDRT